MFRVAVSNKDSKHPNHAEFQYRAPVDTQEEANALLKEAKTDYPAKDGYQYAVQSLEPRKTENQHGVEVTVEHAWKAVR